MPKAIQTILQRYNLLFDEINVLGQKLIKEQPQKAIDDFMDFLIDAYVEGIAGAGYMLGEEYDIDAEKLSTALNQSYDDESIYSKLIDYIQHDDESSLERLIESEVHRIYNAGSLDGASQSEREVKKTWVTVGDERVRDTHRYLEGTSIPLDEHFITYDGDSAPAPGLFTRAENNVNCRCVLQYS